MVSAVDAIGTRISTCSRWPDGRTSIRTLASFGISCAAGRAGSSISSATATPSPGDHEPAASPHGSEASPLKSTRLTGYRVSLTSRAPVAVPAAPRAPFARRLRVHLDSLCILSTLRRALTPAGFRPARRRSAYEAEECLLFRCGLFRTPRHHRRRIADRRSDGVGAGAGRHRRIASRRLWPPPFPDDSWVIGSVSGVTVDSQNNVLGRAPRQRFARRQREGHDSGRRTGRRAWSPSSSVCCMSAPLVLEYDAAGKFMGGWGGPSSTYAWPQIDRRYRRRRQGQCLDRGGGR